MKNKAELKNNGREHILRTTKSICPVCLKDIKASVVKSGTRVFLTKLCPEHGNFKVCLSQTAELYEDFDDFYFSVMSEQKKNFDCELWTTYRCNMDCPICILGREERRQREDIEPSLAQLEHLAAEARNTCFTLSGAESTCVENLAEMIRILKRHGKSVVLNTNGMKLADFFILFKHGRGL